MKYYAKQAVNILRTKGVQGLYNEFLDSELYREIKFRTATRRNWITNQMNYRAPAHPYRLIHVDPHTIEWNLTRDETAINKLHTWNGGLGQVRAWSPPNHALSSFSENYVKRGFVQRFEHGYDWPDTVYYQELRDETDHSTLKQRCAFYDQLYETIRENGYQADHAGPTYRGSIGYKQKLSILTVINAEGELYLWDGRHRLAIAQLIDMDTVPVHVVCRHKEWQQIRDQVQKSLHSSLVTFDLNQNISSHPDMQDLFS